MAAFVIWSSMNFVSSARNKERGAAEDYSRTLSILCRYFAA
jgi:hypothetical protein